MMRNMILLPLSPTLPEGTLLILYQMKLGLVSEENVLLYCSSCLGLMSDFLFLSGILHSRNTGLHRSRGLHAERIQQAL